MFWGNLARKATEFHVLFRFFVCPTNLDSRDSQIKNTLTWEGGGNILQFCYQRGVHQYLLISQPGPSAGDRPASVSQVGAAFSIFPDEGRLSECSTACGFSSCGSEMTDSTPSEEAGRFGGSGLFPAIKTALVDVCHRKKVNDVTILQGYGELGLG